MESRNSAGFDVVVVGSANLDLVARTSRLPKPGETVMGSHFFEACGGKGVNQAIAAARAGAKTAFIGALGRDHAGETLLAALVNDGVDVSAVQRVSVHTGRALIGVSDIGENLIVVVPGANHEITVADIEKNKTLISAAKVLLCQLEVPLAVVQRALASGKPHLVQRGARHSCTAAAQLAQNVWPAIPHATQRGGMRKSTLFQKISSTLIATRAAKRRAKCGEESSGFTAILFATLPATETYAGHTRARF